MDDLVLRTVVKLILPFVQIYGIFIIFNGHLSPGGGFAGGTILGASIILYALAFRVHDALDHYPRQYAKTLESLGVLAFIMVGLLAIGQGSNFLTNYLPRGVAGTLFSGGVILPLTLAIGVKVASTIITLFFHLLEEKKL